MNKRPPVSATDVSECCGALVFQGMPYAMEPLCSNCGDPFVAKMDLGNAKELAQKVMNSMEYDVGVHVLCFYMGVPISSVKRMSREDVMKWARVKLPKATHCHECGQTLPR